MSSRVDYFHRDSEPQPFKPSSKHVRVLDVLARLSLATSKQINTCLYSEGTLTTTRELLLNLFDHGYTDRIPYKAKTFGNPQVVHRLTAKGAKLLRNRLRAGKNIITASHHYTEANASLGHLLQANEVLVQGLKLSKVYTDIAVEIESEPYIRRDPLIVGTDQNKVVIIPDGWLRVRKLRPDGTCGDATMLVEFHTGSQWRRQIEEKVKAYVRMDEEIDYYRRRFGTDSRLVIFITPERDPALVEEVKGFIYDTLKKLDRSHFADLFAVARFQSDDFFFASGLLPEEWRTNAA